MPSKIILTKDLYHSITSLSQQEQALANNFISKLFEQPERTSLNLEVLPSMPDPTIRSGRVSQELRAIISVQPGNVYCIVHIGHHDAAYRWARRRKILFDSSAFQLEVIAEETKTESCLQDAESLLFSQLSDSKLNRLGFTDPEKFILRTITDLQDLGEKKIYFGSLSYELLEFLAAGTDYEEVAEYAMDMRQNLSETQTAKVPAAQPSSDCYVIDSVESLQVYRDALDGAIHQWRIFLHPSQKRIAEMECSGPMKITGEAGTGKTVVALHRAKWLAGRKNSSKIFYTTFTIALAADISRQLDQICTERERAQIKVCNLDKWVSEYLRRYIPNFSLLLGQERDSFMEDAIREAVGSASFPLSFYYDEWERVLVAQEITSFEMYKKASRTGRGYPLSRMEKQNVWNILSCYQRKMEDTNRFDIPLCIWKATELLKANGPEYDHIIVDEAQDFGEPVMKLLRAAAGPEHPNDLCITGDARQNIYSKKMVLKNCGIRIAGRSYRLQINYRTTDEIRRWALQMLPEQSEDELQSTAVTLSLMHGKRPEVSQYQNELDEINGIVAQVKKWLADGIAQNEICIAVRANASNWYKTLKPFLQKENIACVELRNYADDEGKSGVRISSIHRMKGLEFEAVYLAGLSSDLPLYTKIAQIHDLAERKERENSERNLLYVAATRARKRLCVSCVGLFSPFLKTDG